MLPKNWKLTSMLLAGMAIGPFAYHSASGGGGYRDCNGVYHSDRTRDAERCLTSGTKVIGDTKFPCRHCGRIDCLGCWGVRHHHPSFFKLHCREYCSILQAHNAHFYGSLNTGLANALGRPVNCRDDCIHHRGIYAATANSVDPRDRQVYSAQGYGVPMTVPLAPNVGYQYNYGWGVPASRMTAVGADYTRYVPAQWTGAPGRQSPAGMAPPPMVYAPTDTTQFGYTSAHVPYWQQAPRTSWDNAGGGIVTYAPVQAQPVSQPAGQQPGGGVNVPAPPQ